MTNDDRQELNKESFDTISLGLYYGVLFRELLRSNHMASEAARILADEIKRSKDFKDVLGDKSTY